MFNVQNIITSTVQTDPWHHQIIDNFFDDKSFEKLVVASKKLLDSYKGLAITGHDCLSIGQVYPIIGEDVFSILLESNRQILDNIDSITSNFPNHRSFKRYFSVPTFHILPPNFGPQKIHDEAYDKTASIVVYLYPENNVGTAFYRTEKSESFVKELEWKQNRGMLFCGEKHVTWHDFYSNENPRITLNYFIRQCRSTELTETNDYFYFSGVDGPKTILPKTLPKHILDYLTSGVLVK